MYVVWKYLAWILSDAFVATWRLDLQKVQLSELEEKEGLPDLLALYVLSTVSYMRPSDLLCRRRGQRRLNLCRRSGGAHRTIDERPHADEQPAVVRQ